jgi:hypothetical protein
MHVGCTPHQTRLETLQSHPSPACRSAANLLDALRSTPSVEVLRLAKALGRIGYTSSCALGPDLDVMKVMPRQRAS